ncbi:uncharacterized protein LOC122050560 [Zingiber officinale]|uniref:uncharacterized protein LOC122050560 n=1 Tax=Zingiber officinale TaxID=94328 RepID=UPI001C4C3214|nr:uncharacterized protein LOC122050560 [Zingiber officinale]
MGTELRFSTAFHPQTDGQSECTIQTLEDLLRSCVMDFGGSWEDHLHLVEFAYNNGYHSTIQMAPFEALYGRACRSPTLWDKVGESSILGSQHIQRDAELILERIGEVAYQLALPPSLAGVHDVFNVSMLRKYVPHPTHILTDVSITLQPDVTYEEVPVRILDRKERQLWNKTSRLVKVGWEHHSDDEVTWELEDEIRAQYPHLFNEEVATVNFSPEGSIAREVYGQEEQIGVPATLGSESPDPKLDHS